MWRRRCWWRIRRRRWPRWPQRPESGAPRCTSTTPPATTCCTQSGTGPSTCWEQALNETTAAEHADGGLHALVAALIPIGPQLAFLWRTPAFDHMKDLDERWLAVEERSLAVLRRVQELGFLAADLPDWWLGQMLYSVVYVAATSVQVGRLAPLDAPGLALRTLLRGTGEPQPGPSRASPKETS